LSSSRAQFPHRRAATLKHDGQLYGNCRCYGFNLLFGERTNVTLGRHTCPPQHFVGAKVAEASNNGLVEQNCLDRSAPAAERYCENVGIDTEDVDSKMVKIRVK
jgi:hypothetical protein